MKWAQPSPPAVESFVKEFPDFIPVTVPLEFTRETTTCAGDVVATAAPNGAVEADWLFNTAV
jgi:hypothetical protein